MSQAGIVDFEGSHPQVPTIFVTNSGDAVPIANTLEILGTAVAAHSIPIRTTGSGNTVTIEAQYASATASTGTTAAGLASFNSTYFTVDANGFVSLVSSSVSESFTVDAFTAPGTNPVTPNGSGSITVTGGQVAAGTTTNVIRTNSLAANTYTIQIQRSQAVASSTVGDNGVSHFNSTYFTVDSNGFVSLNGSGVGETITGDTGGALSPTAGNWNILGTSTAPGAIPVQTSGSVSTLTIQIQKSQAIGATNAANVGLAAFNSTYFTVDSNGFVSLNGSGVGETITGNTGGALSPTAGNWNILGSSTAPGTTPVQTSGSVSTLTIQVQKSQAIASTNATNVGLAAFNSTYFTVDANGFVSLNGSGVGETITGNTGGALSPTAGNWNILGTSTAAGTTPVQTSGSVSTLTVQVQKSQAIASTNATNVGLAAFNSSFFTVDSNGFVSLSGTGSGQTITGNTGGALSPTAGNWNILGAGGLTTSGSVSTLTISPSLGTQWGVVYAPTTSSIATTGAGTVAGQVLQSNVTSAPTYSTATYPSTTTINQLLYSSANNTVAGLATANRAVITTGATGTPVATALATDGQLIIGSTAGAPAAATLTAGSGITITNASNSITIAVTAGTTVVETLTGNTGGAISPTSGNINTLGTGSITIVGSGSTLTTQLTGLTNHNVLVGAGTATITNLAPSATSGVPLISQGSAADPIFGTAVVAGGGTGSTSFNINGAVYSNTTTTGALQAATLTSGQLLIGGTTTPAAATLTAGAGITITNGNNSITIASSTGGFTWSDTSGTVNAAVQNGYFITGTCTSTLPASPNEGDTIKYIVDTTSLLTITANTGQKIRIATQLSAAAGTAVNTQRGDAITLVYRSTGTTWFAEGNPAGGWNVT